MIERLIKLITSICHIGYNSYTIYILPLIQNNSYLNYFLSYCFELDNKDAELISPSPTEPHTESHIENQIKSDDNKDSNAKLVIPPHIQELSHNIISNANGYNPLHSTPYRYVPLAKNFWVLMPSELLDRTFIETHLFFSNQVFPLEQPNGGLLNLIRRDFYVICKLKILPLEVFWLDNVDIFMLLHHYDIKYLTVLGMYLITKKGIIDWLSGLIITILYPAIKYPFISGFFFGMVTIPLFVYYTFVFIKTLWRFFGGG